MQNTSVHERPAVAGARRYLALVALLAGLGLAISACGSSGESSEAAAEKQEDRGREVVDEGQPQQGGKVVIAVNAETNGWSPHYSQLADAGQTVAGSFFEPLALETPDGDIVPHLLESFTPNEDYTVWTLVARDGITFHNGERFDAEAMKLNFEAMVASPLTGLAQKGNYDSFEVVDDMTLEVTATHPWATFPHTIAGASALQAAPEQQNAADEGTRNPIGTGPYKFEEWVQGDYLTVSAYEDYWNKEATGAPHLDEIEFKVMVDPIARNQALAAGDIDMMFTNSPAGMNEFRDSDEFKTVEDNFSEEVFVQLNQGKPPFDNPDARAALAYGTNNEAVVDILGEGITHTVSSPYQEGSPWYVEDDGYPSYDPAKAKEHLAAYEEATGEPLKFTFLGLNNAEDLALQQVLVEQWRGIGIEAEIDTREQSTFIIEMALAKFEAAWFRNFGYSDPSNNVFFWDSAYAGGADQESNFSINFSQTRNDQLDEDMRILVESDDDAERKAASDDSVRILNEELPYIWLFNTPHAIAYRNGVGGLNTARELGFGNLEPKPWIGGLFLVEGS